MARLTKPVTRRSIYGLRPRNIESSQEIQKNDTKDSEGVLDKTDLKCYLCNKKFVHASRLSTHVILKHPIVVNRKIVSVTFCNIPQNIFDLKEKAISVHDGRNETEVATITNVIPTVHESHKGYKCKSCDKLFTHAVDLNKHIHTIHESHKDYKCESCGKSFSQAGNLKRHIVDEGHKNYKCEFCGKSFSPTLSPLPEKSPELVSKMFKYLFCAYK